MQCNLSKTDRSIRIVLGFTLLGAGVSFRNWWGLLGVPLVVNAAMGVCGLYHMLGISTYKGKKV